jgi:catechol 2,3-dioxygenase-like lactoylglutathione lyase family enzyme
MMMARVTGIGGVFLRTPDPKRLTAWYVEHLGIKLAEHGGIAFAWTDEVPTGTGVTAWSAFPQDTAYFGEGVEGAPQQAMINYRVDDLDGLLSVLEQAGVWIDPKRESYGFGHFAWIRDCDGNRLELWQPLQDEPASEDAS